VVLTTVAILWLAAGPPVDAVSTREKLETVVQSSRESVPAKQLERSSPRYPAAELRDRKQAWVQIAYCIDESGSTRNVSVLDSVGSRKFEKSAIDTVQKWTFEPALVDGQPTWQSRNQTVISFAIDGNNKGASRNFVRDFRKMNKLIEEEKLKEADELFWQIYETHEMSLYELSKLWSQRVRYEGLGGDMYKLDMALHRATASDGKWIDKESYVRLLGLRVQVELRIGKYHAARRSFRKLVKASGEDSEAVLALESTMDKLREMIDGANLLQIKAEVRRRDECHYCNNSWNFTPVRDDFTFTNISGRLESIEMRCDHKRFESAVSDLVEWHIPEDWGTCHVQVYGDPGTTFDVMMLPNT